MGNSQAVKQHLQTSEKTGVFAIRGQKLKEIPEPVQKLDKLRSIDLSNNSIVLLPTWIGSFASLKTLTFNDNNIQFFPQQMANLTKLETLSAAFNQISRLPPEFDRLLALKYLHLQNNIFSEFPLSICHLPNLEVLDLSKNRISKIPAEAGALTVHELNLNNNQISALAEEIYTCPRLKVLRLDENCLPLNGISPKILRDSKISLLTVEGNVFQLKELQAVDGYEQYMERYTATKKKM